MESNCRTADINSAERVMVYFDENNKLKYHDVAAGDVNADGNISVADAVVLQKYLLGKGELVDWRIADTCEDETVDVFDMVLMRKMLVNNF